MRKMMSPSCSSAAPGESHANAIVAGDAAQRLKERRREEHQPGIHDADEAAALRQGGQRQHRRRGEQHLCQREQRDRRQQVGVVADEGETAGEDRLHQQQAHRRRQGDQDQEHEENRHLAGHVLGGAERLGQVQLQRVGAAIVGDEPGADPDRDEEDEDVLRLEELAEGLALRRQERRLLEIGGDVDLHGADDERRPGEQHQRDERALADDDVDAGAGDHLPRRPDGSPRAAVATIALIVDGHDSGLADGAREHVLEGRHTGAQVAHLHALAGRELEEPPRPGVSVGWRRVRERGRGLRLRQLRFRHEDADHVFVGVVTVEPFAAQHGDEVRLVALDPQLVDAAARCP